MRTIKYRLLLIPLLLLLTCAGASSAQTLKRADAYKAGESLQYNLYFNWKFVWVRAGDARLTIKDTIYNGQKAKCMMLLNSTNKRADAFFRMRDTLLTVFNDRYEPLYYRKASVEGKKYRLSQVRYNYLDSVNVEVAQSFLYCDEPVRYVTDTLQYPVYDMMSLLAYARTIDFTTLKKGTRLTFPVATGKRIENQHLVYRDTKRTKSDNGVKYDCYIVSLITENDGKEKEIVNFHVTDDSNHLPVLLDLVLKFGSAKAKLLSMDGLLHEITSVVR